MKLLELIYFFIVQSSDDLLPLLFQIVVLVFSICLFIQIAMQAQNIRVVPIFFLIGNRHQSLVVMIGTKKDCLT